MFNRYCNTSGHVPGMLNFLEPLAWQGQPVTEQKCSLLWFSTPPIEFPETKLSLENIPALEWKKKCPGQMQDKYNNRQQMSGTWSTLGTLKPAYYNIFFIYYSHECVTATGSVNCHNLILVPWHQLQIPDFLCWKFL